MIRVGITETSAFMFKKICHLDVSKLPIKDCVLEALEHLSVDSDCRSVTLPLIGSGRKNNDPSISCQEINNAVSEFARTITHLGLTHIYVCLNKPEHYAEFLKLVNPNGSIRPLTSSQSHDDEDKIIFKLISDRPERIENCKKKLLESTSDQIVTGEYNDDYLDPFNVEIKTEVESLCKENNLKFKWDFDQRKIMVVFFLEKILSLLILIVLNDLSFRAHVKLWRK